MRKHILGFTIFTLIIGSAVLFHTYNYLSDEILVEKPDVPDSCWKMKPKTTNIFFSAKDKQETNISYSLEDWSFNAVTSVLTANVQLKWKGNGKPPAAVVVQLNFFSPENPSKEISAGSESIKNPFVAGNTFTKTITTVVKDKSAINSRENYYGTITIWNLEEFKKEDSDEIKGRMTIISLNNQEKLAFATPVLMIHEK